MKRFNVRKFVGKGGFRGNILDEVEGNSSNFIFNLRFSLFDNCLLCLIHTIIVNTSKHRLAVLLITTP